MVGDLLLNAFACDGLLAEHLASSLTIVAFPPVDSCLVPGLEVIATGIFECVVDTTHL